MELDIDRIEVSVGNNIKTYPQPDEETSLMQVAAGKRLINLLGYFTDDSDFVGTGVMEKAKNLILAGKYWYYGVKAKDTTFPQIHWNNRIYDMLIQKVTTIDDAPAGDELVYYNMGLIIRESV